jgi:hypothetical protein
MENDMFSSAKLSWIYMECVGNVSHCVVQRHAMLPYSAHEVFHVCRGTMFPITRAQQ